MKKVKCFTLCGLIVTVTFLLGYGWLSLITYNCSNITLKQVSLNISDDMSLLYELVKHTTWIADTQYITQRQFELNNPTNDIFRSYAANYPCFWGESFAWNNKSPNSHRKHPMDGGKFLCGVQFLHKPCVVYSFGCHRNYVFEYAYGLSDKCAIYTFDPFNKPTKSDMEQLELLPNFQFYPWGLSNVNNYTRNMYRLNRIMRALNHTHIDILKMDIEGWEFPVFYSLDKLNKWPSIGQIQVEIHTRKRKVFGKMKNVVNDINRTRQRLGDMIELFERHNFRIFHVEPNGMHHQYLAEYALIQKDWRPHIKNYISHSSNSLT
eukprot:399366_1